MEQIRTAACGRCTSVTTATPCMGVKKCNQTVAACPTVTTCPTVTATCPTVAATCPTVTATCPTVAACPTVTATCPTVAATCPTVTSSCPTIAYTTLTPRCDACGASPCACPETREMALRRVQQYGFMTDDLRLFLNTHAECEEAFAALKKYIALEKAAKEAYEKRYGSLTLETTADKCGYDWIACPWPWHVEE